MSTNQLIREQLDLDLPRDHAILNGQRIRNSKEYYQVLFPFSSFQKDIVGALLTQAFYAPIYEIILQLFPDHHVIQNNEKRQMQITWTNEIVRIEQSKKFVIFDQTLQPCHQITTVCDIEPFTGTFLTVFIHVDEPDFEII